MANQDVDQRLREVQKEYLDFLDDEVSTHIRYSNLFEYVNTRSFF